VNRVVAVTLSTLLLAAAANAAAQGPARKPRRDPNVITAEEIATKPAQTLYDVRNVESNYRIQLSLRYSF